MGISNMALVKIAALGGIATVTMGLAFKSKIDDNIKKTVYCKEALKTLRAHRGAVLLLGEPIKDRSIDIGNERLNYTKENSARYEVPVKGPKQRGVMYFWANRQSKDSEWKVDRIELGLDNDPDKRLLIKSDNNSIKT